MRRILTASVLAVSALIIGLSALSQAQSLAPGGTLVQASYSYYALTPISATGAVNTQVTLTIPAPAPGSYNYICDLHFNASQDGTATAINNAATTSTNFNSFAVNFSSEDVAQKVYDYKFGPFTPATGCAKSTAPGTATTFVSPAAVANAAFSWKAAYFQAP